MKRHSRHLPKKDTVPAAAAGGGSARNRGKPRNERFQNAQRRRSNWLATAPSLAHTPFRHYFFVVSAPPANQPSATDPVRWFTEEVEPHEPSLRSYLRGSFPAVRDIDDVVQESYLRLWTRRSAQPIQSVKGFLFTVARRLALDVLRRERRSPIIAGGDLACLDVSDDRLAVTEIVSQDEKVALLIAAIDSLPARCREVVVLRKFKLVPQKDVAARLGVTEKCVENQLQRGLTRCRDYLRRRGIQNFFGDES